MKSLFANVTLVITLALMAGGCGQPLDEIGSSESSQALSVAAPTPTSITFWDSLWTTRMYGMYPRPFTFAVNAPQLLNRLPGTLSYSNSDYCGACWESGGEYYDVFYSDADGSFNAAGRFITVEGVWDHSLPWRAGFNLAEVQMHFSDGTSRWANVVTSYKAMGNNAGWPGTERAAVDGNLTTATGLGNTVGTSSRLRLTVGFEQPSPWLNCGAATVQPVLIWPPDHRFVAVDIGGIKSRDGNPVAVNVFKVFQDEPLASLGAGHFSPDAQIVGGKAYVRADRSARGDGRVYYLRFRASDGRGGTCEGDISVCVPHDQGPGAGCVDQGLLYDSTAAE